MRHLNDTGCVSSCIESHSEGEMHAHLYRYTASSSRYLTPLAISSHQQEACLEGRPGRQIIQVEVHGPLVHAVLELGPEATLKGLIVLDHLPRQGQGGGQSVAQGGEGGMPSVS